MAESLESLEAKKAFANFEAGKNNKEEAQANVERRKAPEVGSESLNAETHPEHNEDKRFANPSEGSFGVFDGNGGMVGGERAASIANNAIEEQLQALVAQEAKRGKKFNPEQLTNALRSALREANNRILEEQKRNPEFRKMGTTASVVKLYEGTNGERKAIIGNVGDSRVYIRRADGRLEQVTVDDSTLTEFAKGNKAVLDKFNNVTKRSELTPLEEVAYSQRNVITQTLGREDTEPRMYAVDIQEGDKILISSDGIHDNLTDKEIAQILDSQESSEAIARNLALSAQNRSRDENHLRAKHDDMTALVIEFPAAENRKQPAKRGESPSPTRLERPTARTPDEKASPKYKEELANIRESLSPSFGNRETDEWYKDLPPDIQKQFTQALNNLTKEVNREENVELNDGEIVTKYTKNISGSYRDDAKKYLLLEMSLLTRMVSIKPDAPARGERRKIVVPIARAQERTIEHTRMPDGSLRTISRPKPKQGNAFSRFVNRLRGQG